MNTYKSVLLSAVSFIVVNHVQAQALPSPPRSSSESAPTRWSSNTSATGTILKKDIRWESKIPLDATYDKLTDEQKAALHSEYEKLEPGDEPPFPADGIKPIFSAIKKAQRVLQARGQLDMIVTVDEHGKATQVEDHGSVYNPQMTDMAQQVLLLTKFKPAVCKGQPCVMQFRFTQKLG